MLSFLYLDDDQLGFNQRAGSLAHVLEAAHRTVARDAENGRAHHQALMVALLFGQEAQEALRVGERAVALNPNDTGLLGEFGTRVARGRQESRRARLRPALLSGARRLVPAWVT